MSEGKRLSETVAASVRRWYDEHGWQRDAGSGLFRDTATFSGAGSSGSPGAAHYEARSYQDLNDTFGAGRYFIDAASGALAHSEYIPWSSEFSARVCIDISGVALREARQRLGDHGLYIQANLAQLPLGDNSIDGGVSAYTIQHVAADEQALAVQELARVLAPGHSLCILTGIEPILRHWAYRLLRPVLRGSTYKGKARVDALYYHPRTADWWQETIESLGLRGEVRTLRLLRPNEYRWLFGRSTWAVKWLRALELALPNATLAFAASALVRITKPVVPRPDGVSSEPRRDSRHPRAPE